MKFRYVAKDKSGRTVKAEEDAPSREELISELVRRELTIISVDEAVAGAGPLKKILGSNIGGGGRVKTFELLIFCRQLATMLHGGVPILRAINSIAAETKNRNFRNALGDVSKDLKDGMMFSESLKRHPNIFSTLFVAIVEAGEKVGALDDMLRQLSAYLEARDRLIKKMRSAVIYPSFVATFFLAAIGVVTLYLIPKFKGIYEGFGAELPGVTLFVFRISDFCVRYIHFMLFLIIAVVSCAYFFIKRTARGRTAFDSILLKLPVFGEVIRKAAVSKFCRTLAILSKQGISITEALFLVGRTSGNIIIENASTMASKLVTEGESIPSAFEKMGIFPSLMMQMVSIGVESGSLPELLDKTSDFYEEQVDMFVTNMSSMIEPILVVSLGGLIGIVVIAMYMPIFRLSAAIAGR